MKQLQIVNTLGQVVKTILVDCNEEENRFDLPTTGLERGIYFINLNSGLETTKIIIQ